MLLFSVEPCLWFRPKRVELYFWVRIGLVVGQYVMQPSSSESSGQLSGRVADTRGKHRVQAELKRLEQEARFLEELPKPETWKMTGLVPKHRPWKRWSSSRRWREHQRRAKSS
ncbi:PREDICTED: uncharacterized protein LOC104822806 isoform X4 [Tarenaya hassleriana]|uniref:uncharacterized protein LOC104822806 isoform X4 n=1 Tax=Tarenaya hassleriana TaxID=28532 RepID=UPI0008FD2D81|nr:PREDICTED: uncharacterized protein LOC104822806 isoform X4 [Tarenaya hassleriana]